MAIEIKSKALDLALSQIEKQFGKGSIMKLGEQQMGLQARLMSQALRKLTSIISRSRTIVVFINQIRMKIGVMFGNPETTTGGNALKFYSSVRIDIRRIGTIKNATEVIGSRTKGNDVKNKGGRPFREARCGIP